eukprot:5588715-Pyramimonas_sp.AAC.1
MSVATSVIRPIHGKSRTALLLQFSPLLRSPSRDTALRRAYLTAHFLLCGVGLNLGAKLAKAVP